MVSQSEGKHFLFAESIPHEMREPTQPEEGLPQEDEIAPGPDDDPPPGRPALRLVK